MDTLLLSATTWDQWAIILIGIVVVLVPWRNELIAKGKELLRNTNMPDTTPDKKIAEEVEVDLSYIINEWEEFLNLLVKNGYKDSAKEFGNLVGKIFEEYRKNSGLEDKPPV